MSDVQPTRRAVVVDDERALAALVGGYLVREGFEVSLVHDGVTATDVLREVDPDVVVLDLGLPGRDGVAVCRDLRRFSDCYVVILTARTEEIDTLAGLAVGADDYVTKPFRPRELMARIEAMLRRPRRLRPTTENALRTADTIDVGPLRIDVRGREATLDGAVIPLTRIELDLLVALASHPDTVFSRRELIDTVWGPEWFGDDHLVDVHVAHVRQKLGDPPTEQRFVRTLRGVGYRIGTGT